MVCNPSGREAATAKLELHTYTHNAFSFLSFTSAVLADQVSVSAGQIDPFIRVRKLKPWCMRLSSLGQHQNRQALAKNNPQTGCFPCIIFQDSFLDLYKARCRICPLYRYIN